METLALGLLAAILQALGYLAYGFKVLKRDITPNATSWLMFAYGTTFLLILEWDRDASIALLALPAICALSSIGIAVYCVRRTKRAWWPEHPLERFSFALDIALTVSYIFVWILLLRGIVVESNKDVADILILACWNFGVFTAFFPILRQVYHHPASEKALPWAIWTYAYATLLFITILEQGNLSELTLYPAINAVVHGAIALRVGYWHWRHRFSVV